MKHWPMRKTRKTVFETQLSVKVRICESVKDICEIALLWSLQHRELNLCFESLV